MREAGVVEYRPKHLQIPATAAKSVAAGTFLSLTPEADRRMSFWWFSLLMLLWRPQTMLPDSTRESSVSDSLRDIFPRGARLRPLGRLRLQGKPVCHEWLAHHGVTDTPKKRAKERLGTRISLN